MTLKIRDVSFNEENLVARLSDGRIVSTPFARFPKLEAARPEQRQDWQLCAAGEGVHWPQLDEDIGLSGLLRLP